MKRPNEIPTTRPEGTWPDEKWIETYPTICEHLGDATWDDGKPRTPSTISLSCQEGRIVVALNDKEMHKSLYRSGESVEEALRAIEKALVDPGADWRAWYGNKKKDKK